MRELLSDLTAALDQGRSCVYCAVVETRGSTPQKAGAAMLVFADGAQRGTLGGGCVEAEVKQRALRVLADGAERPEILSFCLDDNYGWDDGLICGGRMTILADPLAGATRTDAAAYYGTFRQLVESGCGCTEAVVLTGELAGSRYLFDAAGQPIARRATAPPPDAVLSQLQPLSERPAPSARQGISLLPVLPRVTLLIVGGGHVGRAVGQLAAEVDFEVWVVDDRAAYVDRDRFPTAHRLIAGDIGSTLKDLVAQGAITPSTYAIIVTRGHAHDEEALFHLAPTAAGYVGMIGSKRKIKLIFDDLLAKGIGAETLRRVHAPLGLDIGSQTVPEIAVSIVAELIARRNRGATLAEARQWVPVGVRV